MDFDDSPEEAAFRAEVRTWLAGHARPRESGGGSLAIFEQHAEGEEEAWVQACRAWQATKAAGGFAAITWPKEWGGRDGSLMEDFIFQQEEARFDVATGAFGITLGMIAPTLLVHGTDAQRQHVPKMLSGEEIWCQLFSEPGAGSDLAGMRTRAIRDGDEWLLSGQKVWTSGAHYADWGYIIARTDPDLPKHRGLTAFILPMDSPGVTVRPLRQMTGGANFNEIFLDEVRIPDEHRVDAPGSGWRVAITTLMNERFSAGSMGGGDKTFDALRNLASQVGRNGDPVVRQTLMQIYCWVQVQRYTGYRALTAISRGGTPGPEGSLAKLAATRSLRAMADLGVALLGPAGTLDGDWSQLVVGTPGMRLGGGTDEIQRNILGERVLGLPGEPRVDKDVSFADLVSAG